jgi:hypothetical protein
MTSVELRCSEIWNFATGSVSCRFPDSVLPHSGIMGSNDSDRGVAVPEFPSLRMVIGAKGSKQ